MSPTNRQRALIALVQVLGLSVWFSATAVVPSLRAQWGIGSTAAVWLTASVQIGFVAGAVTSALLNLADRIRAPYLLAASALCAAICTAALALAVNGIQAAIPLRFLTGVFLAGVYPVGMKLMASWSVPAERGRSFGILLGALTLGSALPHLIGGLGPMPWRAVMLTAAALAGVAAVIALRLLRPGPHLEIRSVTPNPRHAMVVFTHRGTRLASLGYFGHMWELYALWAWLPMFVRAGQGRDAAATSTEFIAFVAIGVAGAAGCLLGGWASDRFGRSPAAVAALKISGACCVASPIFFAASTAVLVVFLLVWGAAVIADSGVFATVLSETTDTRFVGTALTAQTAIGFLLTVVSIQLVSIVADLIGWQYAFLLLAPGPLLGAVAMSRHHRPQPEEERHDLLLTVPNTIRRSDGGAVPHHR